MESSTHDGTPPLSVHDAFLAAARALTRIMCTIDPDDLDYDDTIEILGTVAENLRRAA